LTAEHYRRRTSAANRSAKVAQGLAVGLRDGCVTIAGYGVSNEPLPSSSTPALESTMRQCASMFARPPRWADMRTMSTFKRDRRRGRPVEAPVADEDVAAPPLDVARQGLRHLIRERRRQRSWSRITIPFRLVCRTISFRSINEGMVT